MLRDRQHHAATGFQGIDDAVDDQLVIVDVLQNVEGADKVEFLLVRNFLGVHLQKFDIVTQTPFSIF